MLTHDEYQQEFNGKGFSDTPLEHSLIFVAVNYPNFQQSREDFYDNEREVIKRTKERIENLIKRANDQHSKLTADKELQDPRLVVSSHRLCGQT